MTHWSTEDAAFMRKAIELAERGAGYAAPNPKVGCVITDESGRIIGEGWHKKFGESHAEVNAHHSIAPNDIHHLPSSTWYVTLEPCNHLGKTPACAGLIESIRPKRVLIGTADCNPNVSGGGIARLRQAGIRVEIGCLESDVQWQNRRFFCNVEKDRAYAVLKWAQSRDGFMDPRNASERAQGSGGVAITGETSRAMTHAWRAEEMGIVIGVETALVDEPQLNVRHGLGRSPKAIVIDPNGRLPIDHPLMRRQGADSIIHIVKEPSLSHASETCPWNPESGLKMLLSKLWKEHGISSILVEGGARTLQQFLHENVWDELKVWTAPKELKSGLKAPEWPKNAIPPGHETAAGRAGSDRWNWAIHPNNR
jgi:diaminohydroxyphosphoribosylaminopyrimidine deaminase/5-amino-6-(5-phosphoribosylamino)uracil reductase